MNLVRPAPFFSTNTTHSTIDLLFPGPTADTALSLLQTHLANANKNYARYSSSNTIGKPTIRVVAPGTFRAYREWRIEVTKCGSGQVKVPVVVHDVETKEWLVGQVVEELGSC